MSAIGKVTKDDFRVIFDNDRRFPNTVFWGEVNMYELRHTIELDRPLKEGSTTIIPIDIEEVVCH